jgi:hypothetical protein
MRVMSLHLTIPGRHVVRGLMVAALLHISTAAPHAKAFESSGAAQRPQPTRQAPLRSFSSDAGIIFNVIKPDKTADFEMVVGRLREALQKTDDPVRKQQAAGWRMFKSLEPGPDGNVLYIFVVDPVLKGAEYAVSKILADELPKEEEELYQKFSDAYASGQSLVNLQLVVSFAPPPPQKR